MTVSVRRGTDMPCLLRIFFVSVSGAGLSDKLTINDLGYLRMIIYLKKKYHFICLFQKSLYLCEYK